MTASIIEQLTLDYAGAAKLDEIIGNLSGAAAFGDFLWTVSDENRTIECLRRARGGFALEHQLDLDELIGDIPGREKQDELDLEAISIASGSLWICGSHCRVRRLPEMPNRVNPELRDRKSRNLLASFRLSAEGAKLTKPKVLPFKGKGSVRKTLEADPYLEPFIDLPSKENGLDIEGIAVRDDRVLLGLRGPLIDSYAVIVSMLMGKQFVVEQHQLHFLDLGGLGIRDLALHGADVLVLAGPVAGATGPFRLYRWQPDEPLTVIKPQLIFSWPESGEKPEAICQLTNRTSRYIVLYDQPSVSRIDGSQVRGDVLDIR